MEETILRVDGLVKRYDRFQLDKVSFSLPRGYIMGFVGKNGAGKSTTIKCIMNLIKYDEGSIEIFGLDSRRNSLEVRNRIGYVSEDQYFYEEMTVEWTGSFIGSYFRHWKEENFNRLLKDFGIDKGKKIKELSKGMKVKLSIALAMAHSPELLILDEPTSGLDPVVRNEILDLFREIIQDEKCSILFSSHITSDIEKIADFVTIIDNGRIIISEEKDSLMEKWKVVKADNGYYCGELAVMLRGVKRGELGFSGITDNLKDFSSVFRKRFPEGKFKTEKAGLDEILLRLVKEE